jgi:hypothetical protein
MIRPFDPTAPLEAPEPRQISDSDAKVLSAYETLFVLGHEASVKLVMTDLMRHSRFNATVREDLDFVEGQRDVIRYLLRKLQDVKDGKHRGVSNV